MRLWLCVWSCFGLIVSTYSNCSVNTRRISRKLISSCIEFALKWRDGNSTKSSATFVPYTIFVTHFHSEIDLVFYDFTHLHCNVRYINDKCRTSHPVGKSNTTQSTWYDILPYIKFYVSIHKWMNSLCNFLKPSYFLFKFGTVRA